MEPTECLALPIPDLGVSILRRLRQLPDNWCNSHNFTQWTVDGNDGWFSPMRPVSTAISQPGADRRAERDQLKARLRQAWTWLETQGYVIDDHSQRGGNFKLPTPEGLEIMSNPDADQALRRVKAVAQLGIDLHPRLRAAGVQQTFRGGDFDSAIRDSFVELEDAVRKLGHFAAGDYGVTLMSKAFSKSGPFSGGMDWMHLVGLQRMFEGAFAVLRNPAGHAPTDLEVEEAVEQVLHADLLMRKLDVIAKALGRAL